MRRGFSAGIILKKVEFPPETNSLELSSISTGKLLFVIVLLNFDLTNMLDGFWLSIKP